MLVWDYVFVKAYALHNSEIATNVLPKTGFRVKKYYYATN